MISPYALRNIALLVVMGLAWGLTGPLAKIAVSTGHGEFGLIFWQSVIGTAFMGIYIGYRRAVPRITPATLTAFVAIALLGTLVPDTAWYIAIVHLPVGVMSILLSLVPMIAFPIALLLGNDSFSLPRLAGLLVGLCGVLLLVLPEASLPEAAMLAWIPLAMVGPLCYAFEGNYVARWGIASLDAGQVLFGASLVASLLSLPLALATDQFINPFRIWGGPEWALVAAAVLHVVTYAAYVWLVGRAGAVFAVQVSYLVTGSGVLWAMLILGETYSPYIWAALVLVMAGVFLVQPRKQDALAPKASIGETGHGASGSSL